MKKKEHKKIIVDQFRFDSSEEVAVYHWLCEAIEYGLVLDFDFHLTTYTLCEAVKCEKTKFKFLVKAPFVRKETREVNLIGQYVYTPDFSIQFHHDFEKYYPDTFILDDNNSAIIDVKGDWSRGPNNTSGITFGPKSAWLYHTQGVFVQKIKPKELFRKTWVPEQARLSPVRKEPVKEFLKPCYKTGPQAIEYRKGLDQILIKGGFVEN